MKLADIVILTLVPREGKENYGHYIPAHPLTLPQKECLISKNSHNT